MTDEAGGLLTVADLATRFGVRETTIREAVGRWLPEPGRRIGRSMVWTEAQLVGVSRPGIGRPKGSKNRPKDAP